MIQYLLPPALAWPLQRKTRAVNPEDPPGQDPCSPPHPSCLSSQGDSRRDKAATHPPEVPAGGRGPPLAPSRLSSPPGTALHQPRKLLSTCSRKDPEGGTKSLSGSQLLPATLSLGNSLENGSGKQISSQSFHSGPSFTCGMGGRDPSSAPGEAAAHSGCSAVAGTRLCSRPRRLLFIKGRGARRQTSPS